MAAIRERVERRLAELGLELPPPPVPIGNYLPAARVGRLVFTSGQTARINAVRRYVGVVGGGRTGGGRAGPGRGEGPGAPPGPSGAANRPPRPAPPRGAPGGSRTTARWSG